MLVHPGRSLGECVTDGRDFTVCGTKINVTSNTNGAQAPEQPISFRTRKKKNGLLQTATPDVLEWGQSVLGLPRGVVGSVASKARQGCRARERTL